VSRRNGRSDGAARDADLDDEIRAHFAMAIAELIKRGESPEEGSPRRAASSATSPT
jgi:hypothetical protein